MTSECARFLDASKESVDFVFFVAQVVANQETARRVATEALLVGADEAEAEQLTRALSEGAALTRRLQRFSTLIFEMLITRMVDNYLTYVSELLSNVFRTRPETLRSSEQVRVDFVLWYDSMDELIDGLAERRVERLAYAGLKQLVADLRATLGFDLFGSDEDVERAGRIVEHRNLIVHNRGVVNRLYLRKVSHTHLALGDRLSFDFDTVFRDIEFLVTQAIGADERAATKWELTVIPYGGAASRSGDDTEPEPPTPDGIAPKPDQ